MSLNNIFKSFSKFVNLNKVFTLSISFLLIFMKSKTLASFSTFGKELRKLGTFFRYQE